jgi:hypothetical protein
VLLSSVKSNYFPEIIRLYSVSSFITTEISSLLNWYRKAYISCSHLEHTHILTYIHTVTWWSDYRRGFDWQSDLLHTFTACDYTLQITVTHRLVFSVTVLTALFDNFFQNLDKLMLPSSRPHRLGGHVTPNPYSSVSAISSGSWPSSWSLDTDRTENTTSNSSIVACVSVVKITWRLLRHCLSWGVFANPFLSNGYFCWLQNSGFQQTCHNIYV